ncbi:hypothetical protein H5J25_16010 [Sphingomonas aliaeris]|uniref:Uncharacterized protein n=1 Tax=Sphingomonas aliaeris TaxID=2759526 RepID=A0A974NXZ2_9SPHN|nr:hypothetical protein H5J25_16010 [Sphingomonas aliaeris]
MWPSLLMVIGLSSMPAWASDAPYYGPMKPLSLFSYEVGYKDNLQKDGSYRIVASVRSGQAIDMAVYRAAELAGQLGYSHVEMLGGSESATPGYRSATLYARPSRSAAAPTTCRSKRPHTCYTADVRQVLRTLSGPDGLQPGVAIVDHVDRYGRSVYRGGYGAGATSPAPPVPIPSRAAPALRGVPAALPIDPQTRLRAALQAARPVQGRDQKQGWTVSD